MERLERLGGVATMKLIARAWALLRLLRNGAEESILSVLHRGPQANGWPAVVRAVAFSWSKSTRGVDDSDVGGSATGEGPRQRAERRDAEQRDHHSTRTTAGSRMTQITATSESRHRDHKPASVSPCTGLINAIQIDPITVKPRAVLIARKRLERPPRADHTLIK